MNYYERHIGDYIKDTVSLSMLEDGAYNRLIDQSYQLEAPLPADKSEVYRLARANTAAERKAVDYVLGKFFDLTAQGYQQKRVDREIQRYQDKQRKARASADARWKGAKGNANADATADANASQPDGAPRMRTHSEGNAHQSPDTSTHQQSPTEPVETGGAKPPPPAKPAAPAAPTPRALRKCPPGFEVSPEMVRWAADLGLSPDALRIESEKFRDHTFSNAKSDWVATWRNWMRRAAERNGQPASGRAAAAAGETAYQRSQRELVEQATGGLVSRRKPQTTEVFDAARTTPLALD